MINKKALKSVAVTILLWFTFSCAGTQQAHKADLKSTEGHQVMKTGTNQDDRNTPYRLKIGDVIEVKFYYTPDLNETLTIRPDGKISLQLVGDIQAAGLTPSELDEYLTDQYSTILHRTEIAVIVKSFSEYKVYVGGEVRNPGVIPLTRRLTLLQAIFDAGGFTVTAKIKDVVIIRKGDDEASVEFLTINLQSVLSKERGDEFLNPFDIVFVPKTTVAKVDQFVSQYINQIIPTAVIQTFQGFLFIEAVNK